MLHNTRPPLMSSLDQYMAKPEPEPVPPPRPRQDPKVQLNFRPSIPQELSESYFVGAGYDGERRAVYLKLYELISDTLRTTSTIVDSSPECPIPSSAVTSSRFNQEAVQ